ncbi:MAG: HIT domain-containing protein [Legionellaceae bacterium]|nr:HIT domain-containing protein [Legionellaceae bacterium]
MKVQLIKKKMSDGFIHALHFRVVSERTYESPLHELPRLLKQLELQNLKSYAIHFIPNSYGRFDIEINSQYPKLQKKHIAARAYLNMKEKIKRLHRLFYKKPLKAYKTVGFDDFFHELSQNNPRHIALHDHVLFSHGVEWGELHEAYQLVEAGSHASLARDTHYHRLKHQKQTWVAPALGSEPCPFDKPYFRHKQVVSNFKHFFVALNYRPIGDTPFHLMIIPHNHRADLSMAMPEHVFELEALLRATASVGRDILPNTNIGLYMQKHAQSGMTVPHIHIHVICPPEKKAFRKDILQQLRFLSSVMAGCAQEQRFLHKPELSINEMQNKIRCFSPPLYKALKRELMIQYRRFTLIHPKFNIKPVCVKINAHRKE